MDHRLSIGPSEDFGYRCRYSEILTQQLINDHRDLCRLWSRIENAQISLENLDEIVRIIGWMEEEISALKRVNGLVLEGQTLGMRGRIEKDLLEISRVVKRISLHYQLVDD